MHLKNGHCSIVSGRNGFRGISGQADVAGHEIAERLAKQAANLSPDGPEPFLPENGSYRRLLMGRKGTSKVVAVDHRV